MLFLHVGLHKTGTTYFQSQVFPHWDGLRYLRNLTVESFLKLKPGETWLASREGFSGGVIAPQREKLAFLERLSRMFPDAKILISFRQHGSYVNAIYSQYLRYGGTVPLSEFFDLDEDMGIVKREDLRFRRYVEAIGDFWGRPPFVFLLSELKDNRARLMTELGGYFGVSPPTRKPSSGGRKNISLGKKTSRSMRKINAWFGVTLHPDGSTRPYRILRRLHLDPPRLCQRWATRMPSEPIMDKELEKRIDRYYADEWSFLEGIIRDRRKLIDLD